MLRSLFRTCAVIGFVLIVFGSAGPVGAAAPRLILAYGSLLPQPVMLQDWRENGSIMAAVGGPAGVREADLVGRPVVRLALYWNSFLWEPYVQQNRLGELQPKDANQQAEFYPAIGGAEPVYVGMMDGWIGVHRFSPRGVVLLAQHGIPTRLDTALPTTIPATLPIAGRRRANRWATWGERLSVTLGAVALVVGGVMTGATQKKDMHQH